MACLHFIILIFILLHLNRIIKKSMCRKLRHYCVWTKIKSQSTIKNGNLEDNVTKVARGTDASRPTPIITIGFITEYSWSHGTKLLSETISLTCAGNYKTFSVDPHFLHIQPFPSVRLSVI